MCPLLDKVLVQGVRIGGYGIKKIDCLSLSSDPSPAIVSKALLKMSNRAAPRREMPSLAKLLIDAFDCCIIIDCMSL